MENANYNHQITWRASLLLALIAFIPFFAWFSIFSDFTFYVNRIAEAMQNNAGTSELQKIFQQQQTVQITFYQMAKMILLNYGQDIIFSVLASIATIILLKRLLSKNNIPRIEDVFFMLIFVSFSLFYAATLAANFTTTGRSIRIFCWALMASILLNGIFFFEIIDKLKKSLKTISASLLVIFIGMSTIFGVFNVYHSPLIRMANLQATEANLAGMEWYLLNKANANTISINLLKYSAPGYLLFGYDSPNPYKKGLGSLKSAPNYFGYDKYNSLSDAVEEDAYLVISKMDRDMIMNVHDPDFDGFSFNNFYQLENDRGVKRIYFNGDAEIMEVTSSAYE